MSFTRRTFLVGAGTGVSLLVLTACTTQPTPDPSPTPTRTTAGLVPAPAGMERSAWGDDTLARGSVSFMAVGSTLEHRESLGSALIDRVFFAGEATSTTNPGTVLGAQLTGNRAADEVTAVSDPSERIAIVGAGAAGAEAARVLALRGFDVVVIEARKRVGGRVSTVVANDWPVPVELGAWRLSPVTDGDVITALERLEISTVSLDGAAQVYRSPTGETDTDPASATAMSTALEWAQGQQRDQSLDDSLDQSGALQSAAEYSSGEVLGDELLLQHLASLATIYGADGSELSSWFTVDDTQPSMLVTGGLTRVVAESLEGVETFLSTTVVGVSYNEKRVSLRLGTGESLSVDRAVVTVPLGVLQHDGIDFDPLLPFSHRTAIASLGMGTVDTVWLRFDEPFWTTDAVIWNLVGTDDLVSTWFNLEPLTGEPVLVGLVGGEDATSFELLDDDELTAALRKTLAPFAS
jgi:monoamine oxidase